MLGEQFPVPIVASLIDQSVMACLQPFEEARDSWPAGTDRFPGRVALQPWARSGTLWRPACRYGEGELHRRAAQAIERHLCRHLAPRLADLARHWAAVAVTGERANAIEWATRAGHEAVRGLAYEEGCPPVPDGAGYRRSRSWRRATLSLLIDLADAQWRSGDLERCRVACEEAVAIAQRIGRPDLVGDVALTVEPVGDLAWDLNVRRWCDDALSQAPG